jgi:tRNA(His) 5'-end guanylyltransferase
MKRAEAVTRLSLMNRTPVIVRVDARAFHSWTRGAEKPFDSGISQAMYQSTVELADEAQGCKLAYVQSDEVSLLLTDFDSLETQPWFGNDLQKIVSISASTMTAAFNHYRYSAGVIHTTKRATFDARAFNLPMDEVANYFLWRAKDWRRNSILGLARAHFSAKQLHGVNQSAALEMLSAIGVEWDSLAPNLRFGSFYLPRWNECQDDVPPFYAGINTVVEKALAVPPSEEDIKAAIAGVAKDA